jgi:CspA family cold shock protein
VQACYNSDSAFLRLSLDPMSRVSAPDLAKLKYPGNGCARAVYAAASHNECAKRRARLRAVISHRGDFEMAPMNGTIKRLVSEKGFGFVAAGDGNEYFFHQSACNGVQFDSLREGQAVTFDKGQGPKGPRAENVRLA